jgi:hypothetical protein
MENWGKTITEQLDNTLKDSKKRDINFFRIEEFKRNIKRADTFSAKCPVCQKQKINISEIVDNINEAINVPGKTRRNYDRLISELATHMQKEHGFYTPFYFSYLYSFFGMAGGLLLGYLLLKLVPAYSWEMLSAGFIIGLIGGYATGNAKDSKVRSNKKLM